jgi:hypothetical protein
VKHTTNIQNLVINLHPQHPVGVLGYAETLLPCTFKSQADQFVLSDDGTMITDLATQKMWEAEEHEFPNVDAAEAYVRDLRLGGFSDWTIADVDLHQTILDRSLREPACNPIFKSKGVWLVTSTPYKADKNKPAGSSGLVWFVHFGYGGVSYYHRDDRCWCRAVRSVSPASQ